MDLYCAVTLQIGVPSGAKLLGLLKSRILLTGIAASYSMWPYHVAEIERIVLAIVIIVIFLWRPFMVKFSNL